MIPCKHRDARILIVDDQEFNLLLLERILRQGGYLNCRSLSDSRNAVPEYLEKQPDLILLDLMMPHLDGVAVMEQLRPLAQATYLPILVLTADISTEARRRALSAGATDFLTKPFDAIEVLLRITNLLETRFLYVEMQRRADERVRLQAALLEQANDAILVRDRQLIQVQRMEAVGALAGGVAHDFNNLLTAIIGFSDLALDKVGKQEPIYELIRQVRDAGNRGASLTRQLLAFSRKQVLAPVILDVNELVAEAEKMLRRLIGEHIALATVPGAALGYVKADPGQLEQVLLNLVVNARDAMPTGGKLTIETRNVETINLQEPRAEVGTHRAWVVLTVTDTGCGMDDVTKTRIFEPFFTTKEVGKGTGLGLAMVYGIVKQSGGFIEVDSAPGRGAAFHVHLPRLYEEKAPGHTSIAVPTATSGGTGTILIVEDEQAVRSLTSLALRSAGYTVLEACDGEEALEVFNQHPLPIDLLVTDLVMPKMTGRQLAHRLAQAGQPPKVLYMSGYTEDPVVRPGEGAAAMPFLQKPFTPDALARKVHEVLF